MPSLAIRLVATFAAALASLPAVAGAAEVCKAFGPQAPRDIASKSGMNPQAFAPAPAATALNLCNIHYHAQAEHKGPGFAIFAGPGEHGGYKCDATADLTPAERAPFETHAGVAPGDTVEVHWVYSSCAVEPGAGLGSCLSDACANPQLRVESQVFLLVNDRDSLQFADFAYAGNRVDGRPQPKELPGGTGAPVVFAGSTTGPSYTAQKCSPYQVTWSVRPQCAKLDIASLDAWGRDNVFKEDHAHGVRELVTAPALLAEIE